MDQIPQIHNLKGGFETRYFKEEKKFPPSFYKVLIFDVLNLLSAFVFSYFSFSYLNNKTGFFPVLLFGIFYFIIIIFQSVLNKSLKKRLLIVFVESILFFYFWFNLQNLGWIFSLWIIFLAFRFWGEIQTYFGIQNSLSFKLSKSTHNNFSKSLVAVILTITGFYIFNVSQNNIFLSKSWFDNVWSNFNYIFSKLYPEIIINNSLNDFSMSFVNYKLKFDSNFKNLLPDEKGLVVEQAKKEFDKNLFDLLNQKEIDFNQKFSDIVYEFLIKKINNLYNLYGSYFLIGWWVMLFLVWFIIGWFLKILIINVLNFIIFEILIYFNVININTETKMKEVLNF